MNDFKVRDQKQNEVGKRKIHYRYIDPKETNLKLQEICI